jgi:flagellar basal-body rod protein FlgB
LTGEGVSERANAIDRRCRAERCDGNICRLAAGYSATASASGDPEKTAGETPVFLDSGLGRNDGLRRWKRLSRYMARDLLIKASNTSDKGNTVASMIDNALFFQQQALGLRAHRQQVLAGNIANADTPHYKARDFDFASALEQAVSGRGENALAVARTHERHFPGTGGDEQPGLMYRVPVQDSADGNTVEMDVERGEFADNAIRYEAGLTFITHQLKMLLAATQQAQ